ncbi:MAG: phage minor capsid protein [Prevotella sp.]|nr:phage minor capsid protein [Prevotella sp.]
MINAASEWQAVTDLNLVNTVMQYKAGSAYKNLVNKIYDDTKRQELLGVLGKHTLEVASGGVSRQEAVQNCIKEFAQKGIPAFVDKLGREWSPEAYINMDIRTTVNNTANAAQDACCDRYDLDLIQISSHMGARPKCAEDQGKIYSRSNRSGICHDGDGNEIPFYPWSSTSYGQPDGILGINCHHHKYPFLACKEKRTGVNFQRYLPYDQEENAARYKEFQAQRAMERRVREGDTSYRNVYSSALDNSAGSGIIEARSDTPMDLLTRKPKPDNFVEPMPKKQLQRIVKSFKAKGGIIQMNEETDAFLKLQNAEGSTLNADTILLNSNPSRAVVFEELIHSAQCRRGFDTADLETRLKCEIEAQEKLIKNSEAYKLSEYEIMQTKSALEAYTKELEQYYRSKGGK